MTVRTIIIDDHALVSAGIEAVLTDESGGLFEVVGSTTKATEAAALANGKSADLAIVDLHMPPPGGLDAIRSIALARPTCRVVAVSGDADIPDIIEALAAGASAFLPKTLGPSRLLAPLSTVMDGGGVVPAKLVERLASRWEDSGPAVTGPTIDEDERLLLQLLVSGDEVAAIAESLHVSVSTVKRRITSLEERFGVGGRTELAHLVGWLRLIQPGASTG